MFAAQRAIGELRHHQHEDDGQKIRRHTQEADRLDAFAHAGFENGRQPEHESVNPDAPSEVLQAQQQHPGDAACRQQIAHARQRLLFLFQLQVEMRARFLAQPGDVLRAVTHQSQPGEPPEDRWNAFQDERHLPAHHLDQIAGHRRHPQHGDGIAENEHGVGPRALAARKPVGEQNQQSREDEAFRHPQQQAVERQQPEDADHSGQGGQRAPGQQGNENNPPGALALRVRRARNLEQEVAEEEQRAEKRRLGAGDVEGIRQTGGGAKPVVGAVQIGQAVSDKNRGQQKQPAPLQLFLNHSRVFRLPSEHRSFITSRGCDARVPRLPEHCSASPQRFGKRRQGLRRYGRFFDSCSRPTDKAVGVHVELFSQRRNGGQPELSLWVAGLGAVLVRGGTGLHDLEVDILRSPDIDIEGK